MGGCRSIISQAKAFVKHLKVARTLANSREREGVGAANRHAAPQGFTVLLERGLELQLLLRTNSRAMQQLAKCHRSAPQQLATH